MIVDTLLSLRVLAAVAQHKSFAFVAARLGLSPAMTSKHVQHIEARVGARLLNRNSRNVSLTEAGARYLMTVRPLLEGLEEARPPPLLLLCCFISSRISFCLKRCS